MRADRVTGLLVAGVVNFDYIRHGLLEESEFVESLRFLCEEENGPIVGGIRFIQKHVARNVRLSTRVDIYLRIVNRLCFEVPEFIEVGERFFGGFAIPYYNGGPIPSLWPVGCVDGRLSLLGTSCAYAGEPFDAVGEFRYFESMYRRRASFTC